MRPFGLRYQFTWWFLLVAVVPAVAGSIYTYHVTRSSLYREAEGLMRGEAAGVADRLDDALAAVQAGVVVTARQVALRAEGAKPKGDLGAAVSVLAAWDGEGVLRPEAWSVFDPQGGLRALVVGGAPADTAAPASDAERALAEAARGAPAGNAVFDGLSPTSRSGRPALTYAAPIVAAAGAPLGSLHVEISADALRPLMGAGVLDYAARWVTDAAGRVVTGIGPAGVASEEPVPAELLRAMAAPRDGATRVLVGDEPMAVVSRPVRVSRSDAPWIVGVVVPESTIYARAGFGRYLALIAALTVVVVFLAYLVSVRITRPIRQLEEGTRRIAQGELDLQLKIEAHNELEQLAQSFHQMAYELKHAQERLVKTERLAAIGEVSLAIHHEINNPLTSVMGFAEMLQQRTDLSPGVREQLIPIYEGAVRMRDIIKRLERVQDRTTDRLGGTKMTDLSEPSVPDADVRARLG
jgi:HAMP domain-containing protein